MLAAIIIVALVGIGFTRLTMFAFEMREEDGGGGSWGSLMEMKRRIAHSHMSLMAKPLKLARKEGGASFVFFF